MMEDLIILQARTDSTRLPGKALLEINGRPMIEWQIKRLRKCSIKNLVLVTTTQSSDDKLSKVAKNLGVDVIRGSIHDVHSRFVTAITRYRPSRFVRITGDCPLVMPDLIDDMLKEFKLRNCDYMSNTNPPTFPDGLDVEVVSSSAFFRFSRLKLSELEKEHVTIGMYKRPETFQIENYQNQDDLSQNRWTVDYIEDFLHVCEIFGCFKGSETEFRTADILNQIYLGKILSNPKASLYRNISVMKEE